MEIEIPFVLASTGESFELGFQPEDTLEKACSYFKDNFQAYSDDSISFIHMGKILGDETKAKDIELNKKPFVAIFVDKEEEEDNEEREFVKNEEDLRMLKFRMYVNDEENNKRIKDLILANPAQNINIVFMEFEEKFGPAVTRFLAADLNNLLYMLNISEGEFVHSYNFNRLLNALNVDVVTELRRLSEEYNITYLQAVLEFDLSGRTIEGAIERIRNTHQHSDQENNEQQEGNNESYEEDDETEEENNEEEEENNEP